MTEPTTEDMNIVGYHVFNFIHSFASLGVVEEE